jgi:hypothetical protein
VVTDATSRIRARFNKAFTEVSVDLRIDDLVGSLTGAHFHCGKPGMNGPVAFGLMNPDRLTVDGNRIRGKLTNADFSGADCVPVIGRPVNNIVALAFAIKEGLVYVNVHSTFVGSGEIRGQMQH